MDSIKWTGEVLFCWWPSVQQPEAVLGLLYICMYEEILEVGNRSFSVGELFCGPWLLSQNDTCNSYHTSKNERR